MSRIPSIDGLPTKSRKVARRSDETPIHIAIVEYLRLVLPDALIWHTPNGGKRSKREAAELKRMGVLAGVPDIAILTRFGVVLFIEVKAPKGRQSPEQVAFHDFCIAAKVHYFVARSVDDVRLFLCVLGVPTREATPISPASVTGA